MSKKYIVIIKIIIFIFIVFAITFTVFIDRSSEQLELMFTLFRPELQKASDDFYSEYLSDNPIVYNYSGKVIGVAKKEDGYHIKFGIEPVIGPHYPVGYDEVEYFIDNRGAVTLLDFSHKKNYEIPSREGVKIKKPIPAN
jgi:hypothetical protein